MKKTFVSMLLTLSLALAGGEERIDWERTTEEATEWLQRYIQIDTVNPPGYTDKGVEFLSKILGEEGIPYQVYQGAPRKPILVAQLGPVTERPALLLLNHADVVAAKAEEWDSDPFAGELQDGFIVGRGALDMKGMGIVELMTMVLLKRHSLPLNRQVLFVVAPDEETGGADGIEWFLENHGDLFRSVEVLNEGGKIALNWHETVPALALVQTAEKGVCWIRMRARGESGHGSMPHANNANLHLVEALHKIAVEQEPLQLVPEVERLSKAIAHYWSWPASAFLSQPSLFFWAMQKVLDIESDRELSAMLRSTVSLTQIESGYKVNVIPSKAEATLDCRLLPGVTCEEWLERLRKRLDGMPIELEPILESTPNRSPFETDLFRTIEGVTQKEIPGAVVTPYLSPGATDSRFFRARGDLAYGFLPFQLTPEDWKGVHGANERLSVENLRHGLRLFFKIVAVASTE